MNIKTNFVEDWNQHLVNELNSKWAFDPIAAGIGDVPLLYFSALLRQITQKSRKYHQSNILVCPDDLRVGYSNLIRAVENGENLLPYQSKLFANPNKFDSLLTEWGIHHFHLGSGLDDSGSFIQRTGPLLFALVREESFFGINILPHGSWVDSDLIETIHNNWPYLLVHAKMPTGIQDDCLTEEQRTKLRKKNCNSTISVSDGTTYLGIGGGFVSSGHNIKARINADRQRAEIETFENQFSLKEAQIIRDLKSAGHEFNLPLKAELGFDQNNLFVKFTGYQFKVQLNFT